MTQQLQYMQYMCVLHVLYIPLLAVGSLYLHIYEQQLEQ